MNINYRNEFHVCEHNYAIPKIKASSYLYDFIPKETNNSIIPNATDCYQCLNTTYLKEYLWERQYLVALEKCSSVTQAYEVWNTQSLLKKNNAYY